MEQKIIVFYCRRLKSTGKPIIVKIDGIEKATKSFSMKNVNIKMKFGNSKGFVKRHGVTTVLEVTKSR